MSHFLPFCLSSDSAIQQPAHSFNLQVFIRICHLYQPTIHQFSWINIDSFSPLCVHFQIFGRSNTGSRSESTFREDRVELLSNLIIIIMLRTYTTRLFFKFMLTYQKYESAGERESNLNVHKSVCSVSRFEREIIIQKISQLLQRSHASVHLSTDSAELELPTLFSSHLRDSCIVDGEYRFIYFL
jgi:hypothetical protein